MCRGLAYMDMCPFTNDDWDSLPHVALTLETPWDPWVLDLEQSDDPDWFEHADAPLLNLDFDAHGDYRHCIAQSAASLTTDDEAPDDHGDYNPSTWASLMEEALDGIVASCVLQANLHQFVHAGSQTPLDSDTVHDNMLSSHHGPRMVVPTPQDYDMLYPLFAWLPHDIIRKTFDITTQYAHLPHNTVLRKHFKLPNLALNIDTTMRTSLLTLLNPMSLLLMVARNMPKSSLALCCSSLIFTP